MQYITSSLMAAIPLNHFNCITALTSTVTLQIPRTSLPRISSNKVFSGIICDYVRESSNAILWDLWRQGLEELLSSSVDIDSLTTTTESISAEGRPTHSLFTDKLDHPVKLFFLELLIRRLYRYTWLVAHDSSMKRVSTASPID